MYFFFSLLVRFKSFPANIFILVFDHNKKEHLLKIGEEVREYFELKNDILGDIKLKVTDKNTVSQWCRDFSIEHINDFKKELLKNIFQYDCADNVEFLQSVFSEYDLIIVLTSTEYFISRKTLTTYEEFINYINNVDGIQSIYKYLDIYFSDNNNVKNKIIEENSNKLDDAYNKQVLIMNGIINVCKDYYENIKKLKIKENYSNNVSGELTEKIDNFLESNSYDKGNLTGMHSVNESLNNEIENIKYDFVRMCNEELKSKTIEFSKMKAEKEKLKKTRVKLLLNL